MLVILAAIVGVIVVLVLVDQGQLPKAWAYAVIPVAAIAAASTRVLTIFKAAAESKRQGPRQRPS